MFAWRLRLFCSLRSLRTGNSMQSALEESDIRANMKKVAMRLGPGASDVEYKETLLDQLLLRIDWTDSSIKKRITDYLEKDEKYFICARANLPRSWSISALIGFHAFIQLKDGDIIEWTQIPTSPRFKDWPQKEKRKAPRWKICRIISAASFLGHGRPQFVIDLSKWEILPRQRNVPMYLPPVNDCFTHVNSVLNLANELPATEIRRVNNQTVLQWVTVLLKTWQMTQGH
jgi:hypothetical protein